MSVTRRYSAGVDAIHVRAWSVELGAWVRRVVAYTASCECGWRSRHHTSMADARFELRWHQGEHESA